jgi:enoyl-[acyl-carrier-protein] reductase (NADH)
VFLASPCADAITGSDFIVDGGLGITGLGSNVRQLRL